MQENSSICELLNIDADTVTKDKLYKTSLNLYSQKEGLETWLSRKTNDLFDIEDKIYLFDLTNTYFEGSMRQSNIAQHGRSKEKRYDCPLIVLALVVNVEGFIKYSAIYEGNRADCTTLDAMIKSLLAPVSACAKASNAQKPIVVIDAGIATKENLQTIVDNNCDYVCVSRSSLKNYKVKEDASPVIVYDNKKRPIELIQVEMPDGKDYEYYMKVISPTKALKENSMYQQFFTRYEEGLTLIAKGITTKGGVKKYDRVHIRLGRLAQKYPSVHSMYDIHIDKNEKDICTSISWTKKSQVTLNKENEYGVYFIKTSLIKPNEKLVWTVYNCIREIESTNRSLKSDLDLRPIFHKTDEASQAHLHLGLLAYWVVNTIRHQLKSQQITSDWRELVRIMNTQKCVTTTMINDKGEHLSIRCCSKPEAKVAQIYQSLKLAPAPFIRKKSVVIKIDPAKNPFSELQINTS
jgi:hypothetical protein